MSALKTNPSKLYTQAVQNRLSVLTVGNLASGSAVMALQMFKDYMGVLGASIPEIKNVSSTPGFHFPQDKHQQQNLDSMKRSLEQNCQTENEAKESIFLLWSQHGEMSDFAECESVSQIIAVVPLIASSIERPN